MIRLSQNALPNLPKEIQKPSYDRNSTGIGIVHMGLGAFHKAHQAFYTDNVLNKFGGDWGICGVSLRRPNARDELMPQNGLYTVIERQSDGETARIIGAIQEILVAPEAPELVLKRLSAPTTKVITLTITEKGYCLNPATKELDRNNADIKQDLETPQTPKSAIGYLALALKKRQENDTGGVTIMSCDNLPNNGALLEKALNQYIDTCFPELTNWVKDNVTFPSTMVDRIVPATTSQDIESFSLRTGITDQGVVKTESFYQWVIEDKFANDRPAWDKVDALLVEDVKLYEHAKLRLLNGPHSAIAYIGVTCDKKYVHDVMADPILEKFVCYLMEDEIAPTVEEPDNMPLKPYMKALQERFHNQSLCHETLQIAMDGSQKIPQRIVAPLMARLKQGYLNKGLCLVIAIWIDYLARGTTLYGLNKINDPMAATISDKLSKTELQADNLVTAIINMDDIFPTDLQNNTAITSKIEYFLDKILNSSVYDVIRSFIQKKD